MTAEQNIAFVHDKRRVTAQERLDKALRRITAGLELEGSAEYYLTMLPPALRELDEATNNLTIVEATIEAELEEAAQ